MTAHVLTAACQPDLAAEREHLAALLPSDASPAGPAGDGECAVLAWARSGLMSLTGTVPGPPLAPAAPVLPRAALLAGAIGELASRRGARVSVDLPAVLSRRATLNSWSRGGGTSANGTCRLVRAADQWLAVNLARPDDVRSVPAMLGRDLARDPWAELRADAATRPAAEIAARAPAAGHPGCRRGRSGPVAGAVPSARRTWHSGWPGAGPVGLVGRTAVHEHPAPGRLEDPQGRGRAPSGRGEIRAGALLRQSAFGRRRGAASTSAPRRAGRNCSGSLATRR